MNKIKKNDMVVILTGKDRTRSGKVIKMVGTDRVLIEGINMLKKNVKPNPQARVQGGIIEREASIHISNVALLNPVSKKADKVGFKLIESKAPGEKTKKVRYFKSNNELVDM